MNKIIIGATIAIITWEIGANLATKFENRAIEIAQAPDEPGADPARKAPEITRTARKNPEPVPTAQTPKEPKKPKEKPRDEHQEEFDNYWAERNAELDAQIAEQVPVLWVDRRVNKDPFDFTTHKNWSPAC